MNRGRTWWCNGKSMSRQFLACLSFTLWCVHSSCVLLSLGICAGLCNGLLQLICFWTIISRFRASTSIALPPSFSLFLSVSCQFPFSPSLLHSRGYCTFRQMQTWKQKWLIPGCSDWCQELSSRMSQLKKAGQTKWVSTSWLTFNEILLHFKGGLLYGWESPFQSLQKIRQRRRGLVIENERGSGRGEWGHGYFSFQQTQNCWQLLSQSWKMCT